MWNRPLDVVDLGEEVWNLNLGHSDRVARVRAQHRPARVGRRGGPRHNFLDVRFHHVEFWPFLGGHPKFSLILGRFF